MGKSSKMKKLSLTKETLKHIHGAGLVYVPPQPIGTPIPKPALTLDRNCQTSIGNLSLSLDQWCHCGPSDTCFGCV